MRCHAGIVLFIVSVLCRSVSPASFTTASVKPHYSCTTLEGQDRVRAYIAAALRKGTGVIALNQMEFSLNPSTAAAPSDYLGFGGSCGPHHDSVVVLLNRHQFSLLAPIGKTSANFSQLPFVSNGTTSSDPGTMCVAHNNTLSGSRPYAGALVRHTASARELCVVAATFPHCDQQWNPSFLEDIQQDCGPAAALLFLVDSNAGCPGGDSTTLPRGANDSLVTMDKIANRHGADWGACSDPAPAAKPTCCDDIKKGFPYARDWFDRTALCRGAGQVTNFQVRDGFVCGGDEEHLYTTGLVNLAVPSL